MGFFDFLPLGSPAINIPQFKQGSQRDSTDLQIKSLLYLFKRLRVNRLASFSHHGLLKYVDDKHWDEAAAESHILKLDAVYNLKGFQQVLLSDPERVLVDWPKNKFRSFCILSEYPSASLLRPLSPQKGTSTNATHGRIPSFLDYKERDALNFTFTIIASNQTFIARELAAELANSLLYIEHHSYVSFASRLALAHEAIEEHCGRGISVLLDEDAKAAVIESYLKKLAFQVQLVRIYQLTMKAREAQASPQKPSSPLKSASDSFNKRSSLSLGHLPPEARAGGRGTLSPKKSLANLSPRKGTAMTESRPLPSRSELSPVKLAGPRRLSARPSIANLQANEIYNPVASPPMSASTSENRITTSFLSHLLDYSKDICTEVWEKCRASVQEKVDRERAEI